MGEVMLYLFVPGVPKPKGSMRHVGAGRMIEQVKGSTSWKADMVREVWAYLGEPVKHEGPVFVSLEFAMPRPKTVKREYPSKVGGDIDKLCRNVLDALQEGGLLKNDSQVCRLEAVKRYAVDEPGVWITVRSL